MCDVSMMIKKNMQHHPLFGNCYNTGMTFGKTHVVYFCVILIVPVLELKAGNKNLYHCRMKIMPYFSNIIRKLNALPLRIIKLYCRRPLPSLLHYPHL